MTEPTQGHRRFRRSGSNSDRVVVLVLAAVLVAVVVFFLYMAFFHQQHDGHGQADPAATGGMAMVATRFLVAA